MPKLKKEQKKYKIRPLVISACQSEGHSSFNPTQSYIWFICKYEYKDVFLYFCLCVILSKSLGLARGGRTAAAGRGVCTWQRGRQRPIVGPKAWVEEHVQGLLVRDVHQVHLLQHVHVHLHGRDAAHRGCGAKEHRGDRVDKQAIFWWFTHALWPLILLK